MQRGSVLPWLLIIILVAVGAVLYYQNLPLLINNPVPLSEMVTPKPSSSPEPQVFSGDLTGMKFTVPVGLVIKKESEEEYFKRANGNIRKNFAYYIQYEPAELAGSFYVLPESEKNLDKAVLAVWVFKNPGKLDPDKFYSKYWYYPFVWGDFTARKNDIAPEKVELIGGKEGKSGIVEYREGKPKFIYLPFNGRDLMLQIQMPTQASESATQILKSVTFE